MRRFYIVTNRSKDAELKYTYSIIAYLKEHGAEGYMMKSPLWLKEQNIVIRMQKLCRMTLTVL